jgi:DNA-binding NarL/FixJ family response regulator
MDPVTYAGVVSYLEDSSDIEVQQPDQAHGGTPDVCVIVADKFGPEVVQVLRATARRFNTAVVLVINEIEAADVPTAADYQVVAMLPRASAIGERLVSTVLAAAGHGRVPTPDLLEELLKDTRSLHSECRTLSVMPGQELTPREANVLRLIADGMDTTEIADKLRYAERTVKNIIYVMTTRLSLRNRPHAVAYALRTGVI